MIFAAVAIVAAAALRKGLARDGSPFSLLARDSAATQWQRIDTLGRGESLQAVLKRGGLSDGEAGDVLRASSALDARRIPAGMEVRITGHTGAAAGGRPAEVALQLSRDRVFRLTRDGESWSVRDERTPWAVDTVIVHAMVHSNLYEALGEGAAALLPRDARTELAWSVADIYEYRIDMSRELQDGDAVRVVFQRMRAPSGAVRIGEVLAAGIERRGTELKAIRYLPRGAQLPEYYDQDGRSLRAAFLRAPLSFRRISSVFGMRKHPILGEWRAHKGTDYAAAAGTPVRSIGDGVVIFAGRRGGYGNCIDVRHPNGFVSRYGHLRAFARGLRQGTRVTMGKTIAFVGMTGLATAPHLHFEVLVLGVQRDPGTVLKAQAGVPLPRADLALFEVTRNGAFTTLGKPAGLVRSAAGLP